MKFCITFVHGMNNMREHRSTSACISSNRLIDCLHRLVHGRLSSCLVEDFVNNTNPTFLAFLYKIDFEGIEKVSTRQVACSGN